MARKNTFCHVEWRSKDAARLQKFYSSLFDWKFNETGMPGYTMADFGNKGLGGGIMQLNDQGPPMPPGMTDYITVEELAPYEEKIKALGGHVVFSNMQVPNMGAFSGFTDVDGNMLALWKPSEPDKKAEKAAKKAAKAAKKAAKKEKKKKK
jgi:predicted enzyme related to lactoylglutathione lyase